MDLWFVDYYHGKSDTGVYSLAVTLAQLVWILPNAIASVLYSYMASSSQEDALLYLNKYVRISFYASLLISVTAFVFFYFTVPLIYGQGFVKSTIMIGILLLGIVPFSIPILAGSLFAGIHKVKYNFFASSIGFVVCLILDIVLIPRYGALGACYATVLSYLSNTIYCVYIIKFVLKGSINISPKKLIDQDFKSIVSILRLRLKLKAKFSNVSQ
jgi:O-antigen/teichoic acid export membrane protein